MARIVRNPVVAALLLPALLGACKSERQDAAVKTTSEKSLPSKLAPRPTAVPPKPQLPRGLRLAILAGQGVGPMRLGATVPTVERLMMSPCDERTDTVCRYLSKGIEFVLKDGVTVAIQIHRPGRQVLGPGKHAQQSYGALNAVVPPDVAVGMLPEAVQKVLGKPKRVEKVTDGGPHHTIERHIYDGLVLEYDRNALNGNIILGGIRIVKPADDSAH